MNGGFGENQDHRSHRRGFLGACWFFVLVLPVILVAGCGAGSGETVGSSDPVAAGESIAISSTSSPESDPTTTGLADSENVPPREVESLSADSTRRDVSSTTGGPDPDSRDPEQTTTGVTIPEPDPLCSGELPPGDSFEADPPWEEGDRFEVTVTMEGVDRLEGSQSYSYSYPVELAVIGHDPSGWDFEWKAEHPVVDGILIPVDAAGEFEQLVDELPRRRFTYHLSSDRVDISILNLDDLRADIDATFDAVTLLDPDPGSPTMLTAEYFRGLDDEGVEFEVGRRAILLHLFEGIRFPTDEPDVSETTIENPFGGDPVPAVEKFELVTPSDENGCVTFRYSESVDHEKARPILIESFRSVFGDEVTDIEDDELALMADDLEMGQELTMTYDPGSGFIRRIEDRSQDISPDGWYENTIVVELVLVD